MESQLGKSTKIREVIDRNKMAISFLIAIASVIIPKPTLERPANGTAFALKSPDAAIC
jgi:hypothetical protein